MSDDPLEAREDAEGAAEARATTMRAATAADEPFLYEMLALAASMEPGPASVAIARGDPLLVGYVAGFGRAGDLGLVAERGRPIGAAWLRLSVGEPHPSKVWTAEVPELAIATVPEVRGEGVGAALLRELLDRARGRYPAVALSVRATSPAVRLYQRLGFVVERELVNRVGGASLAMRLALS